ncbi:MAG: hypothetical protein FH749_11155 [Firmicutes bacterium]|nr:hypothetical protein [Bacillota bacterium]
MASSLRSGADNTSFITNFTGSDRHVLDYLTAEVLNQLPASVQEFLLQTSILTWLHPELCDAVSGRQDSGQLLNQLAGNNLFQGPATGPWYRYHALFAHVLQVHLQEQKPEQVASLHQRAAAWLAENQYFGAALGHSLAADDLEQAASLLNSHPQTIWRQLGLARMTNILDTLPPEILTRFPRLGAYRALGALIQGKLRELPALLDSVPVNQTDEVSGMLAVIRTYLAIFQNDPENILAWAQEAIEKLPWEQILWRSFATLAAGDGHALAGQLPSAADFYSEAIYLGKKSHLPFSVLLAGWKLGTLRWQQGQLHDCQQLCAELQEYIRQHKLEQLPRTGAIHALQALLARERGELELAQAKISAALAACRPEKPIFAWCLYSQILIGYSSRQLDRVRQAIGELEAIQRDQGLPGFLTFQVDREQALTC